jgi:hypothetical protein
VNIHNNSCRLLCGDIVMVKQESHSIPASIDGPDATLECGDQVVHRLEQHIGQDRPFQMTPETFDQIQIGTIRRQPADLDPSPMAVEPVVHGSGVVIAGVVADESDLSSRVGVKQRGQERDEVQTTLALGDHRGDSACGVVHGAIHHLLFVLPRGGHARLMANPRPHPGQEWMLVDFGFVLEDEGFGRVLAERFFFKVVSWFLAWAWARSSRLPSSECLGCCRENCS